MPGRELAKVRPPRASEVSSRPRLFARLDELSEDGVVWIAAPAGSGKSALVASYRHARELPSLWYNVDARDEDVASSFDTFGAALRALAPRRAAGLPGFGV